jgi:hypothetical protein
LNHKIYIKKVAFDKHINTTDKTLTLLQGHVYSFYLYC